MRLELSEMPRGFPVADSAFNLQSGFNNPPGWANAARTKISDLAEVIWKTLQAGAEQVDRIHDEQFAEAQVEHFKQCYSSAEHVTTLMEEDLGPLESPEKMSRMLGKPAQGIIEREGLLEKSREAYRQGKEIYHRNQQAESDYYEQRRRDEREKVKIHRQVRELDNDQCVFCGASVTNNFRYVQIIEGTYAPETVVLSCKSCQSERNAKWYEKEKAKPAFGRFAVTKSIRT
jgi:hypothetical protein